MTLRLPPAESLTVEFKSDRKHLSDGDLVEALVCLANAEGGELRLGVEDDGTPTGCMRSTKCSLACPAWWQQVPPLRST